MKSSNFTPPFRVGKKQGRAVLDSNGHEVVVFPNGLEDMAQEYCDFLNSKHIDKEFAGFMELIKAKHE